MGKTLKLCNIFLQETPVQLYPVCAPRHSAQSSPIFQPQLHWTVPNKVSLNLRGSTWTRAGTTPLSTLRPGPSPTLDKSKLSRKVLEEFMPPGATSTNTGGQPLLPGASASGPQAVCLWGSPAQMSPNCLWHRPPPLSDPRSPLSDPRSPLWPLEWSPKCMTYTQALLSLWGKLRSFENFSL